MSYQRERKVTRIVKDTLVWLPGDQGVLLDNHQPLEEASRESLADVGLIEKTAMYNGYLDARLLERQRCLDCIRSVQIRYIENHSLVDVERIVELISSGAKP